MANPLKQLAGQTAIYGLSSIVARLLNYLLTPLYTSKNVFDPEQYGIITEMYAYVAFLIIFLTYGMETAFFRFASKDPSRKQLIFSTAARSLVTTSAIFMTMATLFSEEIGRALHYPDHTEYVIWFAIIVGLDAIGTLPLARLREENKAYRFAFINLANVGINIGLNLFFLAYCLPKTLAGESNWLIETFYDPEIGVGYVFIANLIASIVKFLLLSPYIIMSKGFDKAILKNMLRYSLPLLVVGIGWYINENFDRILLKFLLFEEKGEVATMQEVGVYGANYKLSIIIMLFIQAFRYAADPFYFGRQG
ncbi:MAG: oligosaccharide flippase family protein, partial [Flavobacteriales bacterium]|nr:oligosaccharide flippase family protein [Flavobacteriales bacterium]